MDDEADAWLLETFGPPEPEASGSKPRSRGAPAAPTLRLVLTGRARDCPLGKSQRIAVCAPGEPVSIGRDRGFEAQRMRLSELAVSKTHATLFVTHGEPDSDESCAGANAAKLTAQAVLVDHRLRLATRHLHLARRPAVGPSERAQGRVQA